MKYNLDKQSMSITKQDLIKVFYKKSNAQDLTQEEVIISVTTLEDLGSNKKYKLTNNHGTTTL